MHGVLPPHYRPTALTLDTWPDLIILDRVSASLQHWIAKITG